MKIRDFMCLSEAGKEEVINLKANYIKEDIIPGYQVEVYEVDDFYVAVYIDTHKDRVARYKACIAMDAVC